MVTRYNFIAYKNNARGYWDVRGVETPSGKHVEYTDYAALEHDSHITAQALNQSVETVRALEAERAQLNTIVIGLKMEMDKLEAECKRLKAECAQLECDLDFLHNQIASGS